ncbi:MAG: hypothetical protein BWY04_00455 [candidate division CPR1 bacterium ADurb.Bin160]|uniref:Uncharacterized protein n=1 Tax=candidate division CPR1 bacterium ADurb.Bin160 TaxID=1852826 RepID=A0A1V5ZPU8_9BACT|nr:MAG: hypothetical protein BWY04_00455 [candidate division CPR1 bacterium ADurb.Bin160]
MHDSNELKKINLILDAVDISDKQLNQIINGGIQTNSITTSQTLPISMAVQQFVGSSNNTNVTNAVQTNKTVQTQANNTITNIGPQIKANTITN